MADAHHATTAVSVVWRGNVQGVGFRATVASICRAHAIVGWVRNRVDGAVEALLVGAQRDVDAARSGIRSSRNEYIRSEESWPAPRLEQSPIAFEITR